MNMLGKINGVDVRVHVRCAKQEYEYEDGVVMFEHEIALSSVTERATLTQFTEVPNAQSNWDECIAMLRRCIYTAEDAADGLRAWTDTHGGEYADVVRQYNGAQRTLSAFRRLTGNAGDKGFRFEAQGEFKHGAGRRHHHSAPVLVTA